MAAVIVLVPTTERGREILDELERRTDQPAWVNDATGERTYYLGASAAGPEAFDAMLDRMLPDWREHVDRVTRNEP